MFGRTPVVAALALATSIFSLVSVAAPARQPATQAPAASMGSTKPQAAKLSQDWKRVRTANFEAAGDAPAESIQRILVQLEVYRATLITRVLGLRTATTLPTLVIVFKDDDGFDRFKPRDGKGHKMGGVRAFFGEQPDTYLIVMSEFSGSDQTLRTAYHEYFHFVVGQNLPDTPTWLNEGLAEFFSTFSFDPASRQSTIGAAIPERLKEFLSGDTIPLDELLSREGTAKLFRSGDQRRISMFYAQSWALVHFLMRKGNDVGVAQIRAYVQAIARDVPVDQAFQSAFAVTTADAPRLLKDYFRQPNLPGLWFQWGAGVGLPEATVSPMTEADAEFVQGDLLLRTGQLADAERSLGWVLAQDPSASAPRVALGLLRSYQGRQKDAIDALQPIAAAETGNLRAHLALARACELTRRYDDAFEAYSRAVAINERSTIGWYGRAKAALALGRVEDSDSAIERLQTLDPGPGWYRDRVYDAFELGDFATAARDARSFMDKSTGDVESVSYLAFVGAICLRRLSRPAEADAMLADARPASTAKPWTSRVMDFMQGKLEPRAFVSSAKGVDEQTEAHAYVGFMLLQAGRQADALEHLRWVKDHGTKTFYEYRLASSELERLEKAPVASR